MSRSSKMTEEQLDRLTNAELKVIIAAHNAGGKKGNHSVLVKRVVGIGLDVEQLDVEVIRKSLARNNESTDGDDDAVRARWMGWPEPGQGEEQQETKEESVVVETEQEQEQEKVEEITAEDEKIAQEKKAEEEAAAKKMAEEEAAAAKKAEEEAAAAKKAEETAAAAAEKDSQPSPAKSTPGKLDMSRFANIPVGNTPSPGERSSSQSTSTPQSAGSTGSVKAMANQMAIPMMMPGMASGPPKKKEPSQPKKLDHGTLGRSAGAKNRRPPSQHSTVRMDEKTLAVLGASGIDTSFDTTISSIGEPMTPPTDLDQSSILNPDTPETPANITLETTADTATPQTPMDMTFNTTMSSFQPSTPSEIHPEDVLDLSVNLGFPVPQGVQIAQDATGDSLADLDQLITQQDTDMPSINSGIPMAQRPQYWYRLSGAFAAALADNSTLANWKSMQAAQEADLIDLDLPRTFPDHAMFESALLDPLQRILNAVALHDNDIGYCQSMNFVAGFMLLVEAAANDNQINTEIEQRVYWQMVQLSTMIVKDIWKRDLAKANAFMMRLKQLVKQFLPDVDAKLTDLQAITEVIVTPWLLCLYTTTLPPMTSARVLDCLLLEGEIALLRAALAMFKHCQSEILQAENSAQILGIFRAQYGPQFADPNAFVQTMYSFDLDTQAEAQAVAQFVQQVIQEQNAIAGRREIMTLQRKTHFDRQELEHLKQEFDAIHDKSSQGIVFTDFKKVLLNIRPIWANDSDLLKLMWQAFDVNNDNQISFGELMTGLSIIGRGEPEERLALLFDSFDSDNSGSIDTQEFQNLMSHISTLGLSDSQPDTDKSATLFKQMDVDANGSLDREEFLALIRLERSVIQIFEGSVQEQPEQQPEQEKEAPKDDSPKPKSPSPKKRVTKQIRKAAPAVIKAVEEEYQGTYQTSSNSQEEDEHVMAIGDVVRHDTSKQPLLGENKANNNNSGNDDCCPCVIL